MEVYAGKLSAGWTRVKVGMSGKKGRSLEPMTVGERWEEGVSGEAEKGESLSQVGLPKHDGLFTCQVVAFVWASHERQKRRSFSSSPSRTTSVVCVCVCVCLCVSS